MYQDCETPSLKTRQRPWRVALVGNPNCGKTTLFNSLTGLRYKVANYPGVTVEKRSGLVSLPELGDIELVDLPGTYSLVPSSPDEQIVTSILFGLTEASDIPDLIVAVVDASKLERNLFLVSQLLELGKPLILALNMLDVAQSEGFCIYKERLSRMLNVPVVGLVAARAQGLPELRQAMLKQLQTPNSPACPLLPLSFAQEYLHAAEALGLALKDDFPPSFTAQLLGRALLSGIFSSELPRVQNQKDQCLQSLTQAALEPLSIEATERFRWSRELVAKVSSQSRRQTSALLAFLEDLTMHRVWGYVILVFLLAILFQSVFLWAQVPMNIIERLFSGLANFASTVLPPSFLRRLLVEGVIPGLGSVVVFTPQIALLFFFLKLLEDSGYLTRAAFLLDRLMSCVGLQGRSFIPLLSSHACAVPGILAARSIPCATDRLLTILVSPLMGCSARLPVYTVLIGAFIPARRLFGVLSLQGLVLTSLYFLGIATAMFVAAMLRLSVFRGKSSFFVMEMPLYQRPQLREALREGWDRVLIFLKNTGKVIVACSVLAWFLASFPKAEGRVASASVSSQIEASYAGRFGQFIEPLFRPLGFNWEISVSILSSFAAREVFISTLATLHNVQDSQTEPALLTEILRQEKSEGKYSLLSGLCLLVFFVFSCQCLPTLAVCCRETGSWRWSAFLFSYMMILAYASTFIAYQIGRLILA